MEDTQVINMMTPHTSDGFYASNNQFQWGGTKGFVEFKMLKNNDLYLRMDLPGVSEDSFSYSLSEDKKSFSFEGDAPKSSLHEEDCRSYASSFKLSCNCCEISNVKGVDVRDGVVRMIFRKVEIDNLQEKPCSVGFGTDQLSGGSCGRAAEEHPYVTKGSKEAYEAIPTADGGLFLTVDMPGVAKGDSMVIGAGGDIRFYGRARKVTLLYDDEDYKQREYQGSVSLLPFVILEGTVRFQLKDGVLRMMVPPA